MEQSKSDSPLLDVNDHHPDCSPVGSPDVVDSHFPLLPTPDDLPPPALSADLRDKIIKQVEYYFSDENLVNDKFLLKYVVKNKDGYVPIGVIASFRKLKSLTKETSLIVSALRESSTLVVSSNGKKVKRRHPYPVSGLKDPMTCTVLVENLPEDHSLENLRKVFGEAGNVENIVVREAHAVMDTKTVTTAEKLLMGKLHALVEYDSVEAAEKAVALLNNEHDWRYGLRVKLQKKMGKPEQRKTYKESNGGEKSSVSNPGVVDENAESREHHQDSHGGEEDGGEHLVVAEDKGGEQMQKEKKKKQKNGDHHHVQKEKNEPQKNRYHQGHGHGHGQGQGQGQGQGHGQGQGQGQGHGQGHGQGQGQGHGQGHGQGRRQKHGSSANAHGHGATPAHNVEVSKPPPGPRMPDGTRGFAIGRGRALVPSATS